LLAVAATAGTAGCFSDRGLAIEIDVAGTEATAVELFLGKTACDASDANDNPGIDCKAIAPPSAGSAPLRGSIWFRDDLAVDAIPVTGPRVTFPLRADTTTTLPIVIAVGLIPSSHLNQVDQLVGVATLHDVTIPAGNAQVLATALVPAGPVQPAAPKAAIEDRVQVWRKTMPVSSCVVAEHWESGAVTRSFVVPAQDPDCDDFVADDCNPAAYRGMTMPGTASRPDCFAPQAAACVLGSRACTDGSATRTGACGAQRDDTTCVPDRFCACTDGIAGTCWQDQIRTMPLAVPIIDCSVATTQVAPLTVCPGTDQDTAMIALDAHFTQDQSCGTPTIASSSLLGFGSSASFGGAVMDLTSPRKPCNFSITWKSGVRTAADPVDVGAIRLQTQSGALVLPLVLRFHPTINNCVGPQLTCTLTDAATDGVWSCAAP
jgi:hypothetical protein